MLRPGTTRDISRIDLDSGAEFPEGFRWGVATASYQIEGGVDEGGRGESIWDRFSRDPAHIRDGNSGDVATDHFHRWREDIQLVKDLNANTYRFSVAWPRIQPTGTGAVNEAGVDFYSGLVDGLLEAGITPWLTLYHWDLPQALQDEGGWANRDTAYRFAEYSEIVFDRLHDRVKHWTTLNEPWVSALIGYQSGALAPGISDSQQAMQAAHHLLLGHGEAVQALRAAGDDDAQIGITLSTQPIYTATNSARDIEEGLKVDLECNRMFLGPLLTGRYPDDYWQTMAPFVDLSYVQPGDEATIGQPIDFIGVNYYHGALIRAADPNDPADVVNLSGESLDSSSIYVSSPDARYVDRDLPHSAMGWEIDPQGLYDIVWDIANSYPDCPPIYITENGVALPEDGNDPNPIDDQERIAYLRRHFQVANALIEEGVDLRGYYLWTLMDCYEWSDGYSRKFGLYHLDEATKDRSPKASATWVAGVFGSNRL